MDLGLTVTDGGVLRGTVPTPNATVIAQSPVANASTREVVVGEGTWVLTAAVVEGSASAFEVFLYPPGSDRPLAQSADNYAPRVTAPGPAVAFPQPGTWRIRIERATTTPDVPYAVEWKTEAPAS